MTLPYDIITFDCYGTLIDWRSGIREAFTDFGRAAGIDVNADDALDLFTEFEPEVQGGVYQKYRDVLDQIALRIARRQGWPLAQGDAGFLANSVPEWRPFADTNGVLERLKAAGYRLGILSNVDNDLLAGTRRHFPVEFDLLVTAEDVMSYKPAPRHFTSARRLIGGVRWLHAAQSVFHDIRPAASHTLSAVWVNRLHEPRPLDLQVKGQVGDLVELAAWLEERPPRASQPFVQARSDKEVT